MLDLHSSYIIELELSTIQCFFGKRSQIHAFRHFEYYYGTNRFNIAIGPLELQS